jgi:hypothetical protein
MIDDYVAAMELMAELEAVLPLPARVTPELRAQLSAREGGVELPLECTITWLHYMGDEGGILCKLAFEAKLEGGAFVSITHLRFDPGMKLARRIAAYQKHRVKRLRREGVRM